MKNIIKNVALVTTGLIVGVVVGRVGNQFSNIVVNKNGIKIKDKKIKIL
ncbi:hypothetical protein ACQV2X_05410 [Facklamia sp. P12945]